ncbi:hypothetical protein [Agrobacterium sp. CG674]
MTLEITQKQIDGVGDTALLFDLGEAAKKFKAWQDLNVRADTALYEVMKHAMAIGKEYDIEILKIAAKANNIGTQKHSTIFGIASKLVFRGIDSSTASTYSTVMEKADAAGITPEGLAAWIIENKGIAKISKPDSSGAANTRELANMRNVQKAKALASGPYKAMVTIAAPNSALVDIKAGNGDMVLLAKFNDAGDMDVVFAYSDGDVVDTMWRKMGEAMSSPIKPRFSNVLVTPAEPVTDEQEAAINKAASAVPAK